MPDINAEELLRKAWVEFCNDYDKKVREYSKSEFVGSRKQAKTEHWILWNEYDLMVQLGRFFYDQLARNSLSEIEMHTNKKLGSSFNGYDFKSELKKLKWQLDEREAQPDLIIVQEDSLGPFLLCAEAKCFHCSERGTAKAAIEKDIETLEAIRDLGIAERVVFILFDDYYWIQNEDIESVAENACKEHNIIPIDAQFESKSRTLEMTNNRAGLKTGPYVLTP
ncbi:MAG: hypothetical protein E3J71_09725 [Candidatus Stahlbacteria bacterium]|nr:MAG: hypothetical protein E3J71_09725 [Candidatus Stahlbacteria bacterium]